MRILIFRKRRRGVMQSFLAYLDIGAIIDITEHRLITGNKNEYHKYWIS